MLHFSKNLEIIHRKFSESYASLCPMLLAIDAYYHIDNSAKTVGILFENWSDSAPSNIIVAYKNNVEPYQSGNFYQRELPCIIALLGQVNLSALKAIIIDGYVHLDDEGRLGLGGYLYQYLSCLQNLMHR